MHVADRQVIAREHEEFEMLYAKIKALEEKAGLTAGSRPSPTGSKQ